MKKWFVYYVMSYYTSEGKLDDFRGFTRVEAPDEYTARQIVVKAYTSIKLTNGSTSKILKVTITNIKEADNGR